MTQYIGYVTGLLHGDLGTSFELQRSVANIIGEQIATTFTLAGSALLLAWIFAVPWTLFTAGRSRRLGAFGSATESYHGWAATILDRYPVADRFCHRASAGFP
ncbi:hypothetical protein [Ochrobactrum teleogrylli]